MSTPNGKCRLALLLGDPCGIGPEVSARVLAEADAIDSPSAPLGDVEIVVIADPWVLEWGAECAAVPLDLPQCNDPGDLVRMDRRQSLLTGPSFPPHAHMPGRESEAAGRYVLQTLDFAAQLARAGVVDGICYASLNKQAMHAAGSRHEDELRYFAERLGVNGYVGEVNTLDGLWTARVSSHVPLRVACERIAVDEILPAIRLLHHTIRSSGLPAPRIAVAGLNPHAGEGGLFGSEEIETIRPAVEAAQEEDIAAAGPFPPDTVFVRARRGEFDGVVTMYHDQGQIAMKLLGFERGVTIHGGLPTPITTPAHGTAFDIAGQGTANPQALMRALELCAQMVGSQSPGSSPSQESAR